MNARPIAGLTGYSVTDAGEVRGPYGPIRQHLSGRGYAMVTVGSRTDGTRTKRPVHRLVCEAFHGPAPSPAHEVRHLNGDPLDNRALNLAWGTHRENMADMVLHGRVARGAAHKDAKLTSDAIAVIRAAAAAGIPKVRIAGALGMSDVTVGKVVRGESWLDCQRAA